MTTTTIEPVRTQVRVSAAPDRAFTAFTAEFGSWWPFDTHHTGAEPPEAAVLEPHAGGRWFERARDGSEGLWGHVRVWEPPHRLVLDWQLGTDFRYDPALHTEVVVTFTADGDGTLVVLEHGGLEAYGDEAARMRETFGAEGGWTGLLKGFAAYV
jgi:uncharacterized protein YndB with AHSA1/START domain